MDAAEFEAKEIKEPGKSAIREFNASLANLAFKLDLIDIKIK
jgi:hypothetical protein